MELTLLHEARYQAFTLDGKVLTADAPLVDEIYALPAAHVPAVSAVPVDVVAMQVA